MNRLQFDRCLVSHFQAKVHLLFVGHRAVQKILTSTRKSSRAVFIKLHVNVEGEFPPCTSQSGAAAVLATTNATFKYLDGSVQ